MSITLAMAPTGANPAGIARAMLAVGDLLIEGIAVHERRPGSVHLTRRQVSSNQMAGVLEAMFEAP